MNKISEKSVALDIAKLGMDAYLLLHKDPGWIDSILKPYQTGCPHPNPS